MARLPSKSSRTERKPRARFTDEYGVLLELLIELRLAAGVTQQQLAERVGKSQAHVSMWERREREISVIDVWKWCGAVGISVSEFFGVFEERVKDLPAQQKKNANPN